MWANKHGCYFYDGRKVNDLLEKGGRPLINQTTWENFLGPSPLVGYSPKKRQVIVVDDISNGTNGAGSASNGTCYIYDMITTSWVKGASGTFTATDKTNFVIDWDGDLLHAASDQTDSDTLGTVQLYKWSDTAATNTPIIITKDIDFGTPSQKKSIKKVYISYTSGSSVPTATYGINGDTTPATAFSSGSFSTSQAKWTTATFVPDSDAKSCYSFQIKITGSSAAEFEINDISIVYRPKSVK